MKNNIKILVGLTVSIFLFWGKYNYVNANESKSENINITYEEYLKNKEKSSSSKKNYKNIYEDKIYTKIYDSIEKIEESVDLSELIEFGNYSEILDIYWNVIQDNPQLFYLKEKMIISNENNRTIVKFEYTEDKSLIKNVLKKEFKEKVDSIISTIIKPNMTELEKELAIHDYIVLNTTYDYSNYCNNTIPSNSYSAYGVLMHGVGVCSGYAEAMKVLLDEVGIETEILSSPRMNHAWNIVTIDNERYHVDATWNDPVPNKEGYVWYTYFNTSDDDLKGHYWDRSQYEQCDSTKYSYIYSKIYNGIYDGGYIYYTGYYTGESGLKRIKVDDGKVELFDKDVYGKNIIIDGDYIYYSSRTGIYKTNKAGSFKQKLSSNSGDDLYKYGNYIYYNYTDYDNGKYIYNIYRFDLSSNKDISIYNSGPIQYSSRNIEKIIHRNNVYFIDPQKHNLYKMNLDGSNIVKITDGEVTNLYFSYNKVYYADSSYRYKSIWVGNPGWTLDYDGWYYTNKDGSLYKGWLNDRGIWYYLNSDGLMSSSRWQKIDGKWYNFDSNGAMKTGWLQKTIEWQQDGVYWQDTVWIYLDKNGHIASGWQNINGKWYYLKNEYVSVVDWGLFDEIIEVGVMQTGWIKDGEKWYYLDGSGAMQTGWIKDGGKWYYLDGSGAMQTGWIKDKGKWYYLDSSGAMQTGWIKDKGKWYYLDGSGAMQTGWIKDKGKWYYMYNSGQMATNTIIDGWKIGSIGVATPIK